MSYSRLSLSAGPAARSIRHFSAASAAKSQTTSAARMSTKAGAGASSDSPYLPTDIPPESPRFVHIPKPPQQTGPEKTVVKGVLPVPADIFKGNLEEWATDPEVLASRTLEPAPEKAEARTRSGPEQAWKVRMAALRRENLRSGVLELYRRSKLDRREEAAQEARDDAILQAARSAPERTSDQLTRPSVPAEVLALLEKRPTTPRLEQPEKVEARRQNYAARTARETARRRAALRKLYTDAHAFIVREDQLDAAIEHAFGTGENPIEWGQQQNSLSVWGLGTHDPTSLMAQRALRSVEHTTAHNIIDSHKSATSATLFEDVIAELVPSFAAEKERIRLFGLNKTSEEAAAAQKASEDSQADGAPPQQQQDSAAASSEQDSTEPGSTKEPKQE